MARLKGSKNKKRPRNSRPTNSMSVDQYKNGVVWDTGVSRRTLDVQEVDYYIYNDLPLDEYYDSLKLSEYGWKNKEKGYNYNNDMKKKKEQ